MASGNENKKINRLQLRHQVKDFLSSKNRGMPLQIDAVTQASALLKVPDYWDPDQHLVEARYYTSLSAGRVRCGLCPHRCVLKSEEVGKCLTRINKEGVLYSRVYGHTAAKLGEPEDFCLPLTAYAFMQHQYLSVGLVGCGLRCSYCISGNVALADPKELKVYNLSPENIVRTAKENDAVINFSINEPTNNFEFTLDTVKIAKKNNVKITMTTSGWVNPEPLAEIARHIDGVWFSFKGASEEEYRKLTVGSFDPVMESFELLARMKKPIEPLIIVFPSLDPQLDGLRRLAQRIRRALGEDADTYLIRFTPSFLLGNQAPTPISKMNRAREICREEGLKQVWFYSMGLSTAWLDEPLDKNIFCHHCQKLLAEVVFEEGEYKVVSHARGYNCDHCGRKITSIIGDLEL